MAIGVVSSKIKRKRKKRNVFLKCTDIYGLVKLLTCINNYCITAVMSRWTLLTLIDLALV